MYMYMYVCIRILRVFFSAQQVPYHVLHVCRHAHVITDSSSIYLLNQSDESLEAIIKITRLKVLSHRLPGQLLQGSETVSLTYQLSTT